MAAADGTRSSLEKGRKPGSSCLPEASGSSRRVGMDGGHSYRSHILPRFTTMGWPVTSGETHNPSFKGPVPPPLPSRRRRLRPRRRPGGPRSYVSNFRWRPLPKASAGPATGRWRKYLPATSATSTSTATPTATPTPRGCRWHLRRKWRPWWRNRRSCPG